MKPFTADLVQPDDVLIFDYDGTLSDFVPDPAKAVVPDQVVADIERLSQRQPVMIVSGRQVEEIDRFLSPLKLPVSGAHGRQFRATGTAEVEAPALPTMPHSLRLLAMEMARNHPGATIEIKDDHAFGFHVRPMAEEKRQAALDEFWERATVLLAGTRYKLQPGNMVIEVCPAGFDKGQAVDHFLSMRAYRGKRAIYFGDDLTDEAAFRILNKYPGSIGVLVGPRVADPHTQTDATYSLPTPAAMREVVRMVAQF